MTDLDRSADDLRRLLHGLTDTVRPSVDEAWAQLLPRLSFDAAPSETDGWSDADHDDEAATVFELAAHAARPRRRRLQMVAAVAAAVALGGLGLVVPRLGGSDVAADRAVPWLLLPADEARFRAVSAQLSPPTSPAGSYTVLLADSAGARGYVVHTEPGADPASFATADASVPGGETVTVRGATAQRSGPAVYWYVGATSLSVTSFGGTVDQDELLAVAEGIDPGADGMPTVGVVPAGLAVRVDGPDAEVVPATRYTIDYSAEDLDAPYDDSVQISVVTAGRIELLEAMYAVMAPGARTTVDVRGRRADVTAGEFNGVATAIVSWEERSGVTVSVLTVGITADEAVAIARSLRTVDEGGWRAAVGPQILLDQATTATTSLGIAPPTVAGDGSDAGGATGAPAPDVSVVPADEAAFPDFGALGTADVLVEGTLEDRPWQARALLLPLRRNDPAPTTADPAAIAGERLCASLDYAARPTVLLVCDESPAASGMPGVLGLTAGTSPRTFVLALLPAGAKGLTMGWADGTTTSVEGVEVPGAGGRSVVVVAVGRDARITSLTSDAGRVEVDVPGARDAEIRLPDGVGGQTSIVSGP